MDSTKGYLNISQVARYMGVSDAGAYKMVERGRLPFKLMEEVGEGRGNVVLVSQETINRCVCPTCKRLRKKQ